MPDQANTRVYIVAHKDFDAPAEPGYVPILAGAVHNHASIAVRDDASENISAKNPQFCELTAQYWVWRNACADWDSCITGVISTPMRAKAASCRPRSSLMT